MRIVFFDVDGVLIQGYHAKPAFQKCWDENLRDDLGLDPMHLKEHFIFKTFVDDVLPGHKDWYEALAEYLSSLQSDVTAQQLGNYWLRKDAHLNQPLFEKIKILKASGQVKLLIATNQEHHRARYLMDDLGFDQYFDDIYYAARLGVTKPSPSFFTKIHDDIGPWDQPPIFFDDHQSVVDMANQVGWEAYQFDTADDLAKSSFLKEILGG